MVAIDVSTLSFCENKYLTRSTWNKFFTLNFCENKFHIAMILPNKRKKTIHKILAFGNVQLLLVNSQTFAALL